MNAVVSFAFCAMAGIALAVSAGAGVAAEPYRAVIDGQQLRVLEFLRTFETLQEEFHLPKVAEQQSSLSSEVGTLFPEIKAEFDHVSVPHDRRAFHDAWTRALNHFEYAYQLMLTQRPRPSIGVFLSSRQEFTEGRYLLYANRQHLSGLRPYWVLPEALPEWDRLDAPTAGLDVDTGIVHRRRTDAHGGYSLYVPEPYDPGHSWPLVIALHGSHGSGKEYLHTWLRIAKSRGYIILAPNSLGRTWSIEQPERDLRSIGAMIVTLQNQYVIDKQRIYATGLSDGGTFTYALGTSCPWHIGAIAPIAGFLPRDYLLSDEAKSLPVHIVHGAEDYIIRVGAARSAHARLQRAEFVNLLYTELPRWGHAYTYSINEKLVLPWFQRHLAAEAKNSANKPCSVFPPR